MPVKGCRGSEVDDRHLNGRGRLNHQCSEARFPPYITGEYKYQISAKKITVRNSRQRSTTNQEKMGEKVGKGTGVRNSLQQAKKLDQMP